MNQSYTQDLNALMYAIRPLRVDLTVNVPMIFTAIHHALGVSEEDLKRPCKKRKYADARFIACFYIKQHTNLSLAAIGQQLGGRDHSTVHYGIDSYLNLTNTKNRAFMAKLKLFEQSLNNLQ